MPIKNITRFVGTVIATSMLWSSTPVYAGFQWVPAPAQAPAEQTQAMPEAAVTPPPVLAPATGNPEPTTPVIISGSPAVVTPPAEQPVPIIAPNQTAPEVAAPPVAPLAPTANMPDQGIATAPVNTETPVASADIVHGFANHVPLTVALRQILPSSYSFSVEGDVDMGVLVSFKGGKPWHDTLVEMLSTVGLVMHEQAQMVVISRSEPIPPAPVATPELKPIAAATPTPAAPIAPAVVEASQAATPVAVPPPAPVPVLAPTPAPAPALQPQPGPVSVPEAPVVESIGGEKVSVIEVWSAERGDSLRKVLSSWSRHAHVELEWLAEYDYPLQASVNYTGTYEDAIRNLLGGFEEAHPQPYAQLHTNVGLGQMVLVVRARGNANRD